MECPFTIQCQGATTVTLDELNELHNYKNRTDEDYAEFINSVTELGFSYPIFMWVDPEGKKWVIDAHGRKQFLTRWSQEAGFTVPPLPADLIFAKDKKEAAKKIAAQESRYGKVDQALFIDFLVENDLTFEEIESFTDIEGLEDPIWSGNEKEKKEEQKKEVTCPNCQHVFTP